MHLYVTLLQLITRVSDLRELLLVALAEAARARLALLALADAHHVLVAALLASRRLHLGQTQLIYKKDK